MKNTIEETTRLLLNGTLSKEDADKILLNICNVMPSLPTHIDAGIEAKRYSLYLHIVWLRQMIEGNEA